MNLLMTVFTMLAFAGVYALIAAMIGERWNLLRAALVGDSAPQPVAMAASRCFNRA